MFKKILKKASVVVMAVSIFSLIGCGDMDKQQAADVEKLLQEKYDQEFKATHIGGRYGTENNDSVTTYVHPVDNEKLVVKAVMGKNGELESDNYIQRLISDSFNQILKKELGTTGIESESNTVVMDVDSSSETNPEISIEEYVNKYKPKYFSADMIVEETANITPEIFEKALQEVYKAGLNTTFQVNIHVILKDDYEACLKKFLEQTEISDSMYVDFEEVDEMKLYIDSEGFHVHQAGKGGA